MTSQRIGWIGTGVMGVSMCSHLLDAGHRLTIFNRTRDKALTLLEKARPGPTHPRP
jgi:3-hydroxyisobutyrate dehydrogenase